MKISTNGSLAVSDYFAPFNVVAENAIDQDLGSGGTLVLPDQVDASARTIHLAVGAGKDGNIYLVNRDSMGKFNPANNTAYQAIAGALGGSVFSMPAYFNGTIYYGPVGNPIKAFRLSNALLPPTPSSLTPSAFPYPGTTPSISANGSNNGIVWAAENNGVAVLHAYDATNLSNELYNSNQAGGRDQFGPSNKFITPMITHGKVYVGTTNSVAVFGLR